MKREIPREWLDIVAKRFFWLAWKAAGGPFGSGYLQNNPCATEEEVFTNVISSGDYPGKPIHNSSEGGLRADYVFGRMLKVGFHWDGNAMEVLDKNAQPEYQAWAHTYESPAALLDAAIREIVGAEEAQAGAKP